MTNTPPLTRAATKLHLRPERHAAFAHLALHHLRATAGENAQTPYGAPAHLDASTFSLLKKYGSHIWPGYAPMRGHLTTDSTVRAGPRSGLCYAKASLLVRGDLKKWKLANDGREPRYEERVLGSPLGKLMRAYLEVLVM